METQIRDRLTSGHPGVFFSILTSWPRKSVQIPAIRGKPCLIAAGGRYTRIRGTAQATVSSLILLFFSLFSVLDSASGFKAVVMSGPSAAVISRLQGKSFPQRVMPRVIAHRGARSVAPENTIPAIVTAKKLGATFCEVDVMLSRDKVAFVHHDNFLERCT
jgi:hypothetical protein